MFSEMLNSISQSPEESRRLVFIGVYRDDEVSSGLVSFIANFVNPGGGSANVTDVKLSTLSRGDVTEMIMTELRLPRRLVISLADVVHKRTHGHALFVVQLLNSLITDGSISYSPTNCRFYWEHEKICILKTADSVASLIVSKLRSMPSGELQCLRIISCFGMQVKSSVLDLLQYFSLAPQGGFKIYLSNLLDQGIIQFVGCPTMVVFR